MKSSYWLWNWDFLQLPNASLSILHTLTHTHTHTHAHAHTQTYSLANSHLQTSSYQLKSCNIQKKVKQIWVKWNDSWKYSSRIIFLVDKTYSNNRQLYANSAIIYSHIDRTKAKMRHSMIDQKCLLYKIEEWKKSDKIFFHILKS